MSIRLMLCGALIGGVVLGGALGCGPSDEAEESSTAVAEQVSASAPEDLRVSNHNPRDHRGCNDPDRFYVSRSPRQCRLVLFQCVEGTTPFFDQCGCGCETSP